MEKKHTITTANINLNLARYMAKLGLLKQYAFFTKLKTHYNHTIIFDYNVNKTAKITGLSHKTCERYIRKLIKHGLIEKRDGHLHLKNERKIWIKKSSVEIVRKKIEVRRWTSYNGILQRLQYLLILENAKQQEYNSIVRFGKITSKILGRRNKREAEILHEKSFVISTEKTDQSYYNSSRQLGRLFSVSHTAANSIIKNLVKKQYIKIEEIINTIKGIRPTKENIKGLNRNCPGYYFKKKRSLVCHSGIAINFLI